MSVIILSLVLILEKSHKLRCSFYREYVLLVVAVVSVRSVTLETQNVSVFQIYSKTYFNFQSLLVFFRKYSIRNCTNYGYFSNL